jgi:hypothetical protein
MGGLPRSENELRPRRDVDLATDPALVVSHPGRALAVAGEGDQRDERDSTNLSLAELRA